MRNARVLRCAKRAAAKFRGVAVAGCSAAAKRQRAGVSHAAKDEVWLRQRGLSTELRLLPPWHGFRSEPSRFPEEGQVRAVRRNEEKVPCHVEVASYPLKVVCMW